MPRVMYKKFRTYSGPVIFGGRPLDETTPIIRRHIDRAVYLTEAVETGRRRGSIFAADGTGMTGGRGQHILVYPKELANEDFDARDDQGGLGALLRRLEVEAPSPKLEKLWEAFRAEGWYLASDGKFRWLEQGRARVLRKQIDHSAGDLVHGAVLRDAITPPAAGRVPKSGEEWETAKRWALLFHGVLEGDRSMEVQWQFEVDHLVHRIRHRKYAFSATKRRSTVERVVYGSRPKPLEEIIAGQDITFELDLALCVFHSHTVNAPAIAYKKLRSVISEVGWRADYDFGDVDAEVLFARELLRALAKTRFGRWNQNIGGGRWERSRTKARLSGFWSKRLFSARTQGIMLANMP